MQFQFEIKKNKRLKPQTSTKPAKTNQPNKRQHVQLRNELLKLYIKKTTKHNKQNHIPYAY